MPPKPSQAFIKKPNRKTYVGIITIFYKKPVLLAEKTFH